MIGCRPLTDTELAALISATTSARDRMLLTVLVYTGARISEILPLRLTDIQRGALILKARNTKTKRSRSVALHPDLIAALSNYILEHSLTGDALLFPQARGEDPKPISRVYAWKVLKKVALAAGVWGGVVGLHSTRKSYAHKLYAATGRDLVATAKGLGHTSVLSTAAYLQVGQAQVDRVARSLKFDISA